MPQQETFFDQDLGDKSIQVVKTYDVTFAREAFESMSEEALRFLYQLLRSGQQEAESEDATADAEFAETIWSEIEDGAREDWKHLFLLRSPDAHEKRLPSALRILRLAKRRKICDNPSRRANRLEGWSARIRNG